MKILVKRAGAAAHEFQIRVVETIGRQFRVESLHCRIPLGFVARPSRHKRDFAGASLDYSEDQHTEPTLIADRYRPVPEPGAGVNVDPLGEGLIKVFPDGFRALFAPAAALPAPVPMPLVESVELPGVVVDGPVVDGPVVPPLVVDPPVEVLPVEPVPVCASAKVLASVNAAANPILMSFMISFLCW
jgi:hypothetical protein